MENSTELNWLNELDGALAEKVRRCLDILRPFGRAVVAYSGGADSTFLLALAIAALGRENVLAAVGLTVGLPKRELEQARQLLASLGCRAEFLPTDEMSDPDFVANPSRRCYYCKRVIFTQLRELAESRGYSAVLCGTNADDAHRYRPGRAALGELGVRTPLQDANLTKADVRAASRAAGLPTWNKPSTGCLVTRIPYNQPITLERLARIERGEALLAELGLTQLRLRDHDPIARIEVLPGEIRILLEHRDRIVPALKALGFGYITLDLEGFRSGSLDETRE